MTQAEQKGDTTIFYHCEGNTKVEEGRVVELPKGFKYQNKLGNGGIAKTRADAWLQLGFMTKEHRKECKLEEQEGQRK